MGYFANFLVCTGAAKQAAASLGRDHLICFVLSVNSLLWYLMYPSPSAAVELAFPPHASHLYQEVRLGVRMRQKLGIFPRDTNT